MGVFSAADASIIAAISAAVGAVVVAIVNRKGNHVKETVETTSSDLIKKLERIEDRLIGFGQVAVTHSRHLDRHNGQIQELQDKRESTDPGDAK